MDKIEFYQSSGAFAFFVGEFLYPVKATYERAWTETSYTRRHHEDRIKTCSSTKVLIKLMIKA